MRMDTLALDAHGAALQAPPPSTEYAPYYGRYIETVARVVAERAGATLETVLAEQPAAWRTLLRDTGPAQLAAAYAPGKWTLAESLVHVIDTERVFAYRLLRIARGDTTPLPGFDQDAWVPESGASRRTRDDLLEELDAVRSATLTLLRTLNEPALMRQGTASGHAVSARALAWMIAGHMAHHLELTRAHYIVA